MVVIEVKGYYWPSDRSKIKLVSKNYAAFSGVITIPVCETGENGL